MVSLLPHWRLSSCLLPPCACPGPPPPVCSGQGMVLFMSLLLLFLLSLLGSASLREADMQQRLANAFLDASLAFQAAESGLRDAEDFLQGTTDLAAWLDADVTDGLLPRAAPHLPPVWETLDWNMARAAETDLPGLQAQPRYIIEYLGSVSQAEAGDQNPPPSADIFRITVVGTGLTSATQVVLQSVFGKGGAALPGHDGRLAWRQLQDTAFAQ